MLSSCLQPRYKIQIPSKSISKSLNIYTYTILQLLINFIKSTTISPIQFHYEEFNASDEKPFLGRDPPASGGGSRRLHVRGGGGRPEQISGAKIQIGGAGVDSGGRRGGCLPPGGGEEVPGAETREQSVLHREGVRRRRDSVDWIHTRAAGRFRQPDVAVHRRSPVGGFSVHGVYRDGGGDRDPHGGYIRDVVL